MASITELAEEDDDTNSIRGDSTINHNSLSNSVRNSFISTPVRGGALKDIQSSTVSNFRA